MHKMHKKSFTLTKGGILYPTIYKDVFEAAKQNSAFFAAGFERESDTRGLPIYITHIPTDSVPYVSKEIKDNFVRNMISTGVGTNKWNVQKICDKDIQRLKEIQNYNQLLKKTTKAMNRTR